MVRFNLTSLSCPNDIIADVFEFVVSRCRVLTEVTATVAPPYPERPLDGFLVFNVEVTPLASAAVEPGRPSPAANAIARILEKQIRDARAIDTEALCIVPGSQVWALRCDVRVLDDHGNLTDASALATMAALLHFRRADVTIRGEEVIIHSYTERAPVPLAVHHIPVCVTFALFSPLLYLGLQTAVATGQLPGVEKIAIPANEIIVLDPSSKEETVSDGSLTMCMNAHKELCGVSKVGGCPMQPKALSQCARVAGEKAAQLVEILKSALGAAETAATERARARHAAAAGYVSRGVVDVSGGLIASIGAASAVTMAAPAGSSMPRPAGAGAASSGGKHLDIVVEDEEDAAFLDGTIIGGQGKGKRGKGKSSIAAVLGGTGAVAASSSSAAAMRSAAGKARQSAAADGDGIDEEVEDMEDDDDNDAGDDNSHRQRGQQPSLQQQPVATSMPSAGWEEADAVPVEMDYVKPSS